RALIVTGVQTCALPISSNPDLPLVSTAVQKCSSFLLLHHILELFFRGIPEAAAGSFTQRLLLNRIHQTPLECGANYVRLVTAFRSEARRVGNERHEHRS